MEGEPPEQHGFRKQREAEQKRDAGNRAAWNSLFMRPDTVAQAIAAHYGVSKSQLLDKEAAGEGCVFEQARNNSEQAKLTSLL